jgi:hypothetical protein
MTCVSAYNIIENAREGEIIQISDISKNISESDILLMNGQIKQIVKGAHSFSDIAYKLKTFLGSIKDKDGNRLKWRTVDVGMKKYYGYTIPDNTSLSDCSDCYSIYRGYYIVSLSDLLIKMEFLSGVR